MIILVDKPAGCTSHDVVAKIRRAVPGKIKIGHTGTLDPMCTGLLTVLTDNYTRLSDVLPSDKSYRATIFFGMTTDTQDITGNMLEKSEKQVSFDQFRAAAESFVGKIIQIPPMYSAIKKNGVPLYKLAREGVDIERDGREVNIYGITDITEEEPNTFSFNVDCSTGTYIRTLCEDIGVKVGCPACMKALRRTKANGFSLSQAHNLEEVVEYASNGEIGHIGISCEDAFSALKKIILPRDGKKYYLNGGILTASRFSEEILPNMRYLVYDSDGSFTGIGESDAERRVRSIWREI